MKLIKSEKTEKYHEIVLQKRFLFWKYIVKYRQYTDFYDGKVIFKYKAPNIYHQLSLGELIDAQRYFHIKE